MTLTLNCGKFESALHLKAREMGGIHYLFRFPNNYGASVIKFYGSYGYKDDLWELAVIYFYNSHKYDISYSTPITRDVLGCLTDADVVDALEKISQLKNA